MKKKALIFSCILISLFLIQFSSAIADWTNFGVNTRSTQAQSFLFNSQFGVSPVITTTMANGLSTNNANIPYQALVPTIDTNGNYLILSNGNYLQVYDKNFNLLTEKNTGISEGQLSTLNYIGTPYPLDNIEEIVGFWKPNSTTLSFRVYNFTGNLSLIFENNFTTSLPVSTNGIKCFNSLGYGECYAFIDETINATTYQHSFLKISYNFNNSVDFTRYMLFNGTSKLYEPPSFIDWDYDGTLEFAGFTSDRALVIDYNGNVEINYNIEGSFVGAKFIRSDAGNYKLLIAVNQGTICGSYYNCLRYRAIKTDGTVNWETIIGSSNSGNTIRNGGIALEDYNGDNYEDIFVVEYQTGGTSETRFKIYKGNDGSSLYNVAYAPAFSGSAVYPAYSLTVARMTSDSTFDFIGARNGYAFLWDTANSIMNFSNNIGAISCVPADLDYDGLTDVICSYPTGTTKYATNYTNQNAYITSVEFNPSTSLQVNSTLTATISATDLEGNYIFYSIRCNDTASYSTDTGSNVKICFYDTLGSYNATIRVRDEFHGTYDTLTQEIEVTSVSSTQTTGGIAIPNELVSSTNNNEGLLPSIYYGTLGFFSNILSPLFIIVVLFLSLAIIITIIAIAVKLVKKAGNI